MKETRTLANVIIDHKEKQTLEEFASMLEKLAQKLKDQGSFVFVQNDKETLVQPSSILKTEVKYIQKGTKHSFEIEFDWNEGEKGPEKMEIR